MESLLETRFQFPGQTAFDRGRVRDVYTIRDQYLVMITTDRISAFDVVLPKPIPYKGAILNQMAEFFLEATKHAVPNWVLSVPDPRVTIGWKCDSIPIEMIVRGRLSGSAWRAYHEGKRELCGVSMPEGLKENDPFPQAILTPTTKAAEGHDQEISRREIMDRGIVSEKIYSQMEAYALKLFSMGVQMAEKRGLILVDTKYEFGLREGKVCVIDEIHTPDSSRYLYQEGLRPLSKEFVRQWLMERGFQGRGGEKIPEMPESFLKQSLK